MTFTTAEFTNIPSKLRSATSEKENNKNQSNNKNCHLPIYLHCHAKNTQMSACIEYVYIYKYINGWIQDTKSEAKYFYKPMQFLTSKTDRNLAIAHPTKTLKNAKLKHKY